ncbi:MAG TPA: 5-(carboxyamino)imidazole ribonucleotide mutase [Dehalococcoidia bacterium]|nr:5-(carboxyamino)imidazole ribonucleotide mutase [Dehalococcoidia bacterium]
MALVCVITGSKNDEVLIEPGLNLLKELSVPYEFSVISAHRNPEKLRAHVLGLKDRGIEVVIAAAGAAAHLPGVVASWTTLPVIGVPLATSELKGIDSLYSIVQMPAGVPVACVGIGVSGVKNAALLAAQILGLKHEKIAVAFADYKRKMAS